MKRLSYIDGLRGIFALVVAAFHFDRDIWFGGGYLAVDFFFILSGFILARVYLPRLHDTSPSAFIGARIARLWPLHVATMALYVVGYNLGRWLAGRPARVLPDWEDDALTSGIEHVLLLHNVLPQQGLSWNYPSWSISVELFVNIFLVFVLYAMLSAPARSRVVAGVGLFVAVCYVALSTQLTELGGRGPITDSFAGFTSGGLVRGFGGIFFGLLVHEFVALADPDRVRRFSPQTLAAKSVLEVVLIGFLFYVMVVRYRTRLDFTAVIVFGVLLALLSVGATSPLRTLLSNRVLIFLGTISYGVYLCHVPLHQIFKRWDEVIGRQWADWQELGIYLASVIALATVLHHAVEKPAQQWLKRWWSNNFVRPDPTQVS